MEYELMSEVEDLFFTFFTTNDEHKYSKSELQNWLRTLKPE